jgi:hypothetical protein
MQNYLIRVFWVIFGLCNYTTVWAICAPDGTITGSNSAITLDSGGCATSGNSAVIVNGASINAASTALTAPTVAWVITNNGSINSSGGFGISMQEGGTILNNGTGTITSSANHAIASPMGSPPILLENYGIISATTASALELLGGATVRNYVNAQIEGALDGISLSVSDSDPSAGSFVFNDGNIISHGPSNYGVILGLGGDLVNRVTGYIAGFVGVATQTKNSTVENFGVIGNTTVTSTAVSLRAGGIVINHLGLRLLARQEEVLR